MSSEKNAVVKINNQQHFVKEGETLDINRIEGEVGDKIEIKDVLLTLDNGKVEIGTPLVKDAKVEVEILQHKRGDKIKTLFFKAKSRYRKRSGQRANFTVIKVNKIS